MEPLKVPLKDGVKIGEKRETEAYLRELSAADVINANLEAEQVKVVEVGGKPEAVIVQSPTLAGVHALRRQIVRLGSVQGPIAYEIILKLSKHDLDKLFEASEDIDVATGKSINTGKEADSRGRDDAPQGGR